MGDFAKRSDAKYENGAIRFFLGDGDERRQYEISGDALLQAFNARDGTANALLDAFEHGQARIQAAAQAAANTPAADGMIILGSGDFDAQNDRGGISPGEDRNPSL